MYNGYFTQLKIVIVNDNKSSYSCIKLNNLNDSRNWEVTQKEFYDAS